MYNAKFAVIPKLKAELAEKPAEPTATASVFALHYRKKL